MLENFKPIKSLSQLTVKNFLKAVGGDEFSDVWMDDADPESLAREYPYIDKDDFKDEYDYEDALVAKYNSEMEDRFDDWLRKYKKFKFPLTVYRAISVPSIDKIDKKKLGPFWSDVRTSAYVYHDFNRSGKVNKGGEMYTLVGKANEKNIDWTFMMFNNMNRSFGDDEQEVNLIEKTPIEIVDVLDGTGISTGTKFKGKI